MDKKRGPFEKALFFVFDFGNKKERSETSRRHCFYYAMATIGVLIARFLKGGYDEMERAKAKKKT